MHHYHINREERHFGFLFFTALISNSVFREEIFALMNERGAMQLNAEEFDVYAEVAIFRDHWNALGNHNNYNAELHSKRLEVLSDILEANHIETSVIYQHDMFWTGSIGASKLWYPGKWSERKIQEIETAHEMQEKELWRCRWLCNAKPDVMIHSGNDVLFIEIKVESGMGFASNGYEQGRTQEDIIKTGKQVIDWMKYANVQRMTLTHLDDPLGITWQEVVDLYGRTRTRSDPGAEMIERHLRHMPGAAIASQARA